MYQNRITVCLPTANHVCLQEKAVLATIFCLYLASLTDSLDQDDALTVWKQLSEDEQLKSTCALMSTYNDECHYY